MKTSIKRCEICNRKLKSKGLIYGIYKIFRRCLCGNNPNPNRILDLQTKKQKTKEYRGFIIEKNNYLTLKSKESNFIFYSKDEANDFSGYGKTDEECIFKIEKIWKLKLNLLEQTH